MADDTLTGQVAKVTRETTRSPWLHIGHLLTTIGLVGGVLAFANSTENKVERTEAIQSEIKEDIKDVKQEAKDAQKDRRKILELLYELKAQGRRNGQ